MKLPEYELKKAEEAAWFAAVAVAVFWAEILIRFDPDLITDWRSWFVAAGAGAVRAAAGALLAAWKRPTP